MQERRLDFMGRSWVWNPMDNKLLQVNDWIKDFNVALEFVPKDRRCIAIQAGGAMGVWPRVMSDWFDEVHTFEPDADNYACLEINCSDRANIYHTRAGLGSHDGFVCVELHRSEHGNAGAYYTMPAPEGIDKKHRIPSFSLDTLYNDGKFNTGRVDFIQLDVEGREADVVMGGIALIERDLPVIMVEDKPLPQDSKTGHKYGEVENMLKSDFGYKVAKKVHRDIILVP